jgi:hypothetical protein
MMRLSRTILIAAIVMAFSAIPVFSGPPTVAGSQQGPRILKPVQLPPWVISALSPKEIQETETEAKKQLPKPREEQLTVEAAR